MARRPDIQYIHFYTDGSAARELAAAPHVTPISRPKPRKRKRKVVRIYPLETLAVVTAVLVFIMILAGTVSYVQCLNENQRMRLYVTELESSNQQLSQQYKDGYDLEQIEKMAQAIGMVPLEQVEQIPIQVSVPEPVQEESIVDRFVTFLTFFFA